MKSIFLKTIVTIFIAILGIGPFTVLSTPVFAAGEDICSMQGKVAPEVYKAAGCDHDNNQLPDTITNILYSIIGIAGLVAVIFVIIGGINYITSTGDSAKLEKAKKTIIYACIGLAICALSFAIVNWAIAAIR